MPRAFSSALCDLVKADLQNGIMDLKTLQANHNISDTKVRAMKRRFLATGEVINTNKRKPTGRRRLLTSEHEEHLLRFLNEYPDSYLKDMCRFMEDTYQLRVTEATLQRTCVRLRWKLRRPNKPRDEQGYWVRTLPRDENDNPIPTLTPGMKRPSDWGTKMTYPMRRALMEKTRSWVKEYMSQPDGHDYNHVIRVAHMSLDILRVEQGDHRDITYDSLAIELVALMHDVDHKYRSLGTEVNTGDNSNPSSSLADSQRIHSDENDQSYYSNTQLDGHNGSLPPEPASSHTVEDYLLRIGWPPYITSKVNAITPWVSYKGTTFWIRLV